MSENIQKFLCFFNMATKEDGKKFLDKTLFLPHLFWGEDDAKKAYPQCWKKGHQVVVLSKHFNATKSQQERLKFTADDGDEYVISAEQCRMYWSEKRFKGIHHFMFQTFSAQVVVKTFVMVEFVGH